MNIVVGTANGIISKSVDQHSQALRPRMFISRIKRNHDCSSDFNEEVQLLHDVGLEENVSDKDFYSCFINDLLLSIHVSTKIAATSDEACPVC